MKEQKAKKREKMCHLFGSVELFIYFCTNMVRRQAAFRYRPNEFVFTLNLHCPCR